MVSDTERRALFDALVAHIGPDQAATLMEMLPPVGWSDVARQADITAVRGEMAGLRGEMAELRGEMAELRAELRGEMAELRGELRATLPRLVTANIASMFAVAGLVLAAARLA
jgi:hypothetical protein